MKVFISWSGPRSKELANSLRDWLPMVLHYVEPFVSDKDIAAGDRWAQKIAGELENANFGIICITPENIDSEWILFESGALSKSMLDGKVIPLLFGLELSELSGPLSQFQAQKLEETGIMEVIKAINEVTESKADENIINRSVPALWPELQTALDEIPKKVLTGKHKRPQHEILEELVTGVRGLNSRMRDFGPEIDERERFIMKRHRRYHPRLLEETMHMFKGNEDSIASLLILAGFLRNDLPWLAELILESYREIRDGGPDEAEKAMDRLHRAIEYTMHGPMMREMHGVSKDMFMLVEELPMLLDMAIEPLLKRSRNVVVETKRKRVVVPKPKK